MKTVITESMSELRIVAESEDERCFIGLLLVALSIQGEVNVKVPPMDTFPEGEECRVVTPAEGE